MWRFLAAEMKGMTLKSLALIFVLAGVFSEGIVWSRSNDMKQVCVNCHTMHNSQNGATIPGNSTTRGALLNSSCVGCHTGDNVVGAGARPVVLHTTIAAVYQATGTEGGHNTLAGGDFYWVANGAGLKGHNVDGVVSVQLDRTPPGGNKTFGPANPLTCAGVNGCHGKGSSSSDIVAMSQTHHAARPTQPLNGTSLIMSYRWLHDGDVGYIAGYEDLDYELAPPGPGDHNQYKGIARGTDSDGTTSISHSCAGCHGDFHFGAANSGTSDGAGVLGVDPWIRHPVDFAMPTTGEYAGYGGGSYNVRTPVGRTDADTAAAVYDVPGTGGSIVVCVSCHRAHGSPYDYSLRWDYKNWPGGVGAYNGCGDCHTDKN